MDNGLTEETTEPLPNGAALPTHPADTTAREVVSYGRVWDDADGTTLHGGLHESEIQMLMSGEQMALKHLYRYAIRNKKIYHTRRLVTVDVKCREASLPETSG